MHKRNFQKPRLQAKKRANKDKPSAHIEHNCTASIGLTLFFAQDNTIDELLKQADRAMYQAKQNGRNSVRCYRNIEQAI
ncbi:diguanylate cyclase [Denitrificimonas caeni]|uniref:diguanylate cyclase n=1 Tax=Denitrificimonas caeni TaxID=521720 RepID=UPI003B3A602D